MTRSPTRRAATARFPGAVLRVAAEIRGATLAELSRVISRSAGYVGRFVDQGVPAALDAADRDVLARYLGIDAALLS